MFNLNIDICLVPFHAILTEINVFKLKQTFLEPPRISWKGPIETDWTTFTIFLRLLFQLVGWFDEISCSAWVKTLLKEISARDSSSNWLGQVYVRFTIWESFVKRLLQLAATWNSKWSKILSIVWFHGQYVAFVLEDMHLLIRRLFLTTSANVLTIKYNASQHKLLHVVCTL
jgi:hypothetical protein